MRYIRFYFRKQMFPKTNISSGVLIYLTQQNMIFLSQSNKNIKDSLIKIYLQNSQFWHVVEACH